MSNLSVTTAPKIYVCRYLNADMALMQHTQDHPVTTPHVCAFISPLAYEAGHDRMYSVYQDYWKRLRS